MHTIDKRPNYLLVTLLGEADWSAFANAIQEEIARDDYPSVNDIWQLDNCVFSVKHDQMRTIVNLLLAVYPHKSTRTKTALVTSSGIGRALVQQWIDVSAALPYEKRIFTTIEEAELWIA